MRLLDTEKLPAVTKITFIPILIIQELHPSKKTISEAVIRINCIVNVVSQNNYIQDV